MAMLAQTASAEGNPAPLSLSEWLETPLIEFMKLSPDGRHVAGIGKGSRFSAAFVTNVDTDESRILARWEPQGYLLYGHWPKNVSWINSDLLALDYSSKESISVDLSGKRVAKLGEQFLGQVQADGKATDSALVFRDIVDGDVDLVNARSGERQRRRASLPRGTMVHRVFDDMGVVRAVTMMDTAFWSEKTQVSNWYRAGEDAPWQLLEEGPVTAELWSPMRVLPGPDSLAVLSRQGRDTYAVFRYDVAKRQVVDLMIGHPHEDIGPVSGLSDAQVARVSTVGIKPRVHWFDARWAALQVAVDSALPGRINTLSGNKSERILVHSRSDVDPGRWFVLDTQTSKMREIGRARPKIDPKRMRPMETIQYAARDGLVVNAYLTRPERDQPAPMVVLIHGGPHVRDHWGWDRAVQLLASQGYVVFQPQFRGSTGFGRRFEVAGYRQWGLAMQDDITDGVQHLVAQKIADPARICIYGASYGGYAALWGLIKTPDLYRCGASFAGVSDLATHVEGSIFDDSNAASREWSRLLVGDPKEMRSQLDEVSPLKHADRIQAPLFIAHGESDVRVLPSQSKSMVRALERLDKPVETLWLAEVGHGFTWLRDELRFYKALLAFLKKHIGDRDAPDVTRMPAAASGSR
jgi:dipeptidyl aminopeptidase/acylaminoacyl peptidase